MVTEKPATDEDNVPQDPAEQSPMETSKPIGDAIPTPVEPGLDQPLPEKGERPDSGDEKTRKSSGDDDDTPIGETDPPNGVPEPGPSDFA